MTAPMPGTQTYYDLGAFAGPPSPRTRWPVVAGIIVAAVVVLALLAGIQNMRNQSDARLRRIGALNSDVASTQSDLSSASSDLDGARADAASLRARLSTAQSQSSQATAVGRQFDQCVQDVGTFLERLSAIYPFGSDPTLEAYGTQVGTECREARDAFAALVSTS